MTTAIKMNELEAIFGIPAEGITLEAAQSQLFNTVEDVLKRWFGDDVNGQSWSQTAEGIESGDYRIMHDDEQFAADYLRKAETLLNYYEDLKKA